MHVQGVKKRGQNLLNIKFSLHSVKNDLAIFALPFKYVLQLYQSQHFIYVEQVNVFIGEHLKRKFRFR